MSRDEVGQFSSSEPSSQFLSPSHRWIIGTQPWSLHVKSVDSHIPLFMRHSIFANGMLLPGHRHSPLEVRLNPFGHTQVYKPPGFPMQISVHKCALEQALVAVDLLPVAMVKCVGLIKFTTPSAIPSPVSIMPIHR